MFFGILIFVASCGRPSMVVSSVSFFPTNATPETALFKLFVSADYGLGKAYSDISEKQVSIEIDKMHTLLMRKEYSIKGADLNWKVDWNESSVQIRFYEREDATNVLRTIVFKIDPATDQAYELDQDAGKITH